MDIKDFMGKLTYLTQIGEIVYWSLFQNLYQLLIPKMKFDANLFFSVYLHIIPITFNVKNLLHPVSQNEILMLSSVLVTGILAAL